MMGWVAVMRVNRLKSLCHLMKLAEVKIYEQNKQKSL